MAGFFAANPGVLSETLPVRLLPCDILPLGRVGHSEPDFLIYPGSAKSTRVHGVIELKRPDQRVVSQTRRNVISLTRDAATAVDQLKVYDGFYDAHSPVKRSISLASGSHLFVIMGNSVELERFVHDVGFKEQLLRLLPKNTQILHYDDLLKRLESRLPVRPVLLVPDLPVKKHEVDQRLQEHVDHLLRQITYMEFRGLVFRATEEFPVNLSPRILSAHENQVLDDLLGHESASEFPPAFGEINDHLIASSFNHPSHMDYRFSSRAQNAFYCATDQQSALAERVYDAKSFAQGIEGNWRSVRTLSMYSFEISATLADLRSLGPTSMFLEPGIFGASIHLGSQLRAKGISGVIYRSQGGPGHVIALFRPDIIRRVGMVAKYYLEMRPGEAAII